LADSQQQKKYQQQSSMSIPLSGINFGLFQTSASRRNSKWHGSHPPEGQLSLSSYASSVLTYPVHRQKISSNPLAADGAPLPQTKIPAPAGTGNMKKEMFSPIDVETTVEEPSRLKPMQQQLLPPPLPPNLFEDDRQFQLGTCDNIRVSRRRHSHN